MLTIEEPLALAQAITQHGNTQTLVLVDCLTLWLTNYLFPSLDFASNWPLAQDLPAQAATVLIAIENSPGPVVLVSNEIGLGVIPMGQPTREFVDTLGWLNQDVAQVCERVTFMAAGLPLTLKGQQ
jgi:adenosylcobinamide kinase / adenosylcobinamide-phosphate guanylyltransferase